jgi:hypothetical protein
MSLKDFVTKLGLQSLSDHERDKDKRYKMRRRKEHNTTDANKENLPLKDT